MQLKNLAPFRSSREFYRSRADLTRVGSQLQSLATVKCCFHLSLLLSAHILCRLQPTLDSNKQSMILNSGEFRDQATNETRQPLTSVAAFWFAASSTVAAVPSSFWPSVGAKRWSKKCSYSNSRGLHLISASASPFSAARSQQPASLSRKVKP